MRSCAAALPGSPSLIARNTRDESNPSSRKRLNIALSFVATFIGLPDSVKYHSGLWNPMTHGNISLVIVLLLFRFVRGDF
ncbi:hypothetical protein DFH94DRAFT_713835 [Russula ochroleuca]|uniref:Uncharacterized protein n=1 Tax=Russula ochroleuca TaxID=152965 RepID=A0A9P5N2C0_9AGAM|nr:hypothetical protein DFH94DRAFT_713835 [Russula ochroleuca]